MGTELVLWIVVATALAFDFTNGFHDTANAVATSISTRAMKPRVAVSLAAVLNFAGAFLSLEVAATVASGIVEADLVTPAIVFAGLIGAIAWNLLTWYFGLPSSSSHALIGGVVGAAFAAEGARAAHLVRPLLALARDERRAEDDGRDLPGAGRQRHAELERRRAHVGDRVGGVGHRAGHVRRRLADHPDDGHADH